LGCAGGAVAGGWAGGARAGTFLEGAGAGDGDRAVEKERLPPPDGEEDLDLPPRGIVVSVVDSLLNISDYM